MQKRSWIGIVFSIAILLAILTSGMHAQNSGTVRAIQADDVNNLRPVTLLEGHAASIAEMSFSPDGSAFLSASFDGSLCVWNVSQAGQRPGQKRFCLTEYQAGISQFTWSANGRYLALSSDAVINIYRTTTVISKDEDEAFSPHWQLSTHDVPLLSLGFLDNDRLVAVDVLGDLHLYMLPFTSPLISINSLDYVFLDAENSLLILKPNGQLVTLDTEVGIIRSALEVSADHILISPNQEWLLTWGNEVELWAIDEMGLAPAQPLHTLDIELDGAHFSPEGSYLVTWLDEMLTFWDTETGEMTATLPDHRSGVSIIRWIESEERVLTVSKRGTGRYWRMSSAGIPVFSHWLVGEVDRIDISPDSDSFITMRESFDARFYSFSNGQLRGNFPLNTQIVFSPDWSLIASATVNLITWYGLRDDPRQFDWMPFGVADGLVNIRETPSQDLPRIGTFSNNTSVFVRGRTEDAQWLSVQLPDNSTGWILANRLRDAGDIENLPIIKTD